MIATPDNADSLEVSVVVPAYNERARILVTLSRSLDFLHAHHPSFELTVVDDGSTDDTAAIVAGLAEREPRLQLLRQPRNLGKGAAVQRGMLAARGHWILFMDADLATPIEELDKLLLYAAKGYDVVIGSRGLPESDIRTRQPFYRQTMGRSFNVLVRLLGLPGVRDTQCGFKLYSRAAAHDLFAAQTLAGYTFDVEILMLARRRKLRVYEVPVVWRHAPHSKVSPITDATRMFLDLVRLRVKMRGR